MSNPTQYKFSYEVKVPLKRGGTFLKTGIITGIHARHAVKKLIRNYPGSKPEVEPYFNGKYGGSDLSFGSHYGNAKKEKFNDATN